MGCKAGRCKTSTPQGIFIVTPSLEGRPSKAKEAPSAHEVRLAPLDSNPVLYLGIGASQRNCARKPPIKGHRYTESHPKCLTPHFTSNENLLKGKGH